MNVVMSRLIDLGDRMAREMVMRDGELLRAEIWADAVRIVRARKDSGQRITVLVGWREIEDSRINPLIGQLESLLQWKLPEEIAA